MRKTKSFFIFSLLLIAGCAGTVSSTGQKENTRSAIIKAQRLALDKKYVGYDKHAFEKEYGKPRRIIKRKTQYYVEAGCSRRGCPRAVADEFWSYLNVEMLPTGKTYFSVYVYIKDGQIVRIR